MQPIQIFDPTQLDPGSQQRGGGRFISILKENLLGQATFITDLSQVHPQGVLLIPFFNPFTNLLLDKKIAKQQIIIIYDTIPLKYASHFPVGLKGNINVWLSKRALKQYDLIVTISEVSKKDIIHYLGVPEEKIKVVYPTLSKSFANSKSEVRNPNEKQLEPITYNLPPNFCLYVGDVNWNKNIANLAKAIKIANVPCVFVGKEFETLSSTNKNVVGGTLEKVPDSAQSNASTDGKGQAGQNLQYFISTLSHPWQLEFKNFIEEIGNNPNFIFPGHITDEQLLSLYQKATVNLLLSRDEGFGFSYIEASSQKCPSLLADTPIFREISADNAFFTNPEHPQDIAEKIQKIFEDKNTQKEMGEKAYERSKFFSPEKFKEKLLNIL